MDLVDAASYHQLVLNTEGRSPKTLRLYLIYERRFLAFLDARGIAPALDALNPLNARQALLWFQQRRVGTRDGEVAARMFLNVLKTWAAFLEREGVWEESPLRRVRRVKIRKLERKPYSRAEVNALLGACELSRTPARDRLLVHLLLDTGARISEAMGLCLADINLEERRVRVLGKGNRERTIPIGVSSVPDGGPLPRALRTYLKVREQLVRLHPGRDAGRLFLTLQGFPLTGDGGTEVIKRLGEHAGIDGAIPHRFRHTFATVYLTQYPGDEQGLRGILGHVSADVLSSYVHIAQQVIADRAGRMAPSQHWLREGSR